MYKRLIPPLKKLVHIRVRNSSNISCEKLNESSVKKLMKDVDSFLFDCGGVLWDGRGAIPGSLETLQKLIANGKKVFYITNTNSKTREEYLEKCREFGYPATLDDVVCTSYLAALYLHNKKFDGKVYVVGNPAMGIELDAHGIRHTGIGPDPTVGSITDWIDFKFDPEVNCVLVGMDFDVSYMKILKAVTYLQRPDCLFLATNEDTHQPVKNSDVRVPGAGSIVKAVSFPAEKLPTVVGKPAPAMFEELQKAHKLDADRCLMVGDRLQSDIGLAKACGLKSLLVLSGVTSEADVPRPDSVQNGNDSSGTSTDPPIVPDFYTSCLGDFGKFI